LASEQDGDSDRASTDTRSQIGFVNVVNVVVGVLTVFSLGTSIFTAIAKYWSIATITLGVAFLLAAVYEKLARVVVVYKRILNDILLVLGFALVFAGGVSLIYPNLPENLPLPPHRSSSASPGPSSTSPPPTKSNKKVVSLVDMPRVGGTANTYEGKTSSAIADEKYATGVQLLCSPEKAASYVKWNVSGYTKFVAYVGIDNNAKDADDLKIKVDFSDQNGRTIHDTVTTAIGQQPAGLSINNLANVQEFQIYCVTYDSKNPEEPRSARVVLADAQVSRR